MPEELALLATTAAALGVVWGGYVQEGRYSPLALRPPGALAETDFLGACIRCGLCAIRCPTDAMTMVRSDIRCCSIAATTSSTMSSVSCSSVRRASARSIFWLRYGWPCVHV